MGFSTFGGDPSKIFVCAEGSGAHVVLLSVLQSALHIQKKGLEEGQENDYATDCISLAPIYGLIL